MAVTLEIKYFNSFLLKKTLKSVSTEASWCGDPANPDKYPLFPIEVDNSTPAAVAKGWYVEESRIFGGFNEAEVELGVRAYIEEEGEFNSRSKSSLIYSGIYNSRISLNRVNVFSVAENISKSLDPRYGAIDMLYAKDTNILVLQESKVSSILVNKDALYTAEGDRNVTSSNLVLGDVSQYAGDYGTGGFPESFAFKGNREYFADIPNGAVIRISADGITEIQRYGMDDYFRDEFKRMTSQNKRESIDVTWTIPWGLTTNQITIGGENLSEIELGMAVEGIDGESGLYIVNIVDNGSTLDLTLNKSMSPLSSPQPSVIQCVKIVRDRVIGGYDNSYENYVISMVYNPPSKSSESGLVSEPIEEEFNPS